MTIPSDPQEQDPVLGPLIEAAGEEAKSRLAERGILPGRIGYCHKLWAEQKALLKQRHNIDWKSPQSMNPGVVFD